MKSIIEFINEKQNFLVKGHTKDQNKKEYITDRDINVLDKGFNTFYNDIKISIDYHSKKDWDKYEYKQEMLDACLDILLSSNKSKKISQIVWTVSDGEYLVKLYDKSGKAQPKIWLAYKNKNVILYAPNKVHITNDKKRIIDFINDII